MSLNYVRCTPKNAFGAEKKRSGMNKAVMDDHEEVFFKTFGAHGLNFCITPHENLGRYFLAESTVLFMF